MFSRVDFPLPLTPTMPSSSPRIDHEVQALQGHHFEVRDLVDLDQVVADDQGSLISGVRLAHGYTVSPSLIAW